MRFKIPFTNKTFTSNIEEKATPAIVDLFKTLGGVNTYDSAWHQLSPLESLTFFQEVSAVKNAVDIIVDEFCSIIPRVWNTKTKEWVDNHPINNLFNTPNPFETKNEFLRGIAINYLVTGNAFLVQTGPLTGPPREISNISPLNVIINRAEDGETGSYQVSTVSGSVLFNRVNTRSISIDASNRLGEFRFVDSSDAREIAQIKTFNPSTNSLSGNLFGLSPLTAVFYEIKQFIESSVHNWSLLKRGARPTGALASEDELTDDQFQKLQAEINNAIAGSENSGRPLLLEKGMKWVEMAMTNRDMDFHTLKKMVVESIYNQYKIPLPLVLADTMTLSNFDSAKLALYDNTVIPLAKFIYSDLTQFMLRRYPNSEDLILSYDPHDIPALELRRVDSVEKLTKMGIFTTNELRTKLGYEAVEGGDDILRPANLLPTMNDQFTTDNLSKPRPKTPRKEFTDIVRQNWKSSGVEELTFDQINDIAKQNGLN